jgi:hypothetical protein
MKYMGFSLFVLFSFMLNISGLYSAESDNAECNLSEHGFKVRFSGDINGVTKFTVESTRNSKSEANSADFSIIKQSLFERKETQDKTGKKETTYYYTVSYKLSYKHLNPLEGDNNIVLTDVAICKRVKRENGFTEDVVGF